jgi:hypothetical protein
MLAKKVKETNESYSQAPSVAARAANCKASGNSLEVDTVKSCQVESHLLRTTPEKLSHFLAIYTASQQPPPVQSHHTLRTIQLANCAYTNIIGRSVRISSASVIL